MKIRIKHILRCYQSGMSIRSISSSLLISRNTVKRYIRIYEDMGIELERLLKMDEHHLHELFGTETDNESTGSAEYKYLQEHIPELRKFRSFLQARMTRSPPTVIVRSQRLWPVMQHRI